MPYFAHSGTKGDKRDWQSLKEHCEAVARLAAESARPFGLEQPAYVAGLMHDLGKFDPAFQRRLDGVQIAVDHSTAGAAILMQRAKGTGKQVAEPFAYCILGHHAGLPDKNTADASCLKLRIDRFANKLDLDWEKEIDCDFSNLMPSWVADLARRQQPSLAFDTSVITRFLFSCLVDADFKETEAFYAKREEREPDRHWLPLSDLLVQFTAAFDRHMAGMPGEGSLNELRHQILFHVRAKAGLPPGLFTLTVPTGGGKTLASLGFALDHAKAHGLRRVIYAIPFTSIIDQTADIFRRVLGGDHILEHHSAIDEERPDLKQSPTTRDRLKLAMEDWAAPVIVTTNVQFFESLFAARTSRARKLHNIAGSVIILDEAQTIPRHLLKPCVRMLDSLARLFRCSIVLCTATQPALGRTASDGSQGFPGGLDLAGRELAPDPEDLAKRLRRCRILRAGAMDNSALIDAIGHEPQALVIVNSRKHALELYRQASDAKLDGLVHLTTRQCAAHRRKILTDVRSRLKSERPCRVIATSLIEAGVDIDFPKVWRAQAGWDQVMQAAGRCNREGLRDREQSVVTVFESPGYLPPPEIRQLVKDTARALDGWSGDLQSLQAIRSFFGEVYWRAEGKLGEGVLADFKFHRAETDFAFRKVAEAFRLIENTMVPVIIPFDEKAKKAVDNLGIKQIPSGRIARELQSYTVQTPQRARELLIRGGHVSFANVDLRGDQFAILRKPSLYTEKWGLIWEVAEYLAAEESQI